MIRIFTSAAIFLMALTAVHSAPVIALTDCRISAGPGHPSIVARCGTLHRPLDPTDDSSEQIALAIAIVPALSLEPALDPFVPITGGPGQSSINFYAGWSAVPVLAYVGLFFALLGAEELLGAPLIGEG